MLLLGACLKADDKGGHSHAHSDTNSISEMTWTEQVHNDINDVIDLWDSDHHDESIKLLLKLTDNGVSDTRLRPFLLSEREFVALPNWQSEWQEILPRFNSLNAIARELDRKARLATEQDDYSAAGELLHAMERLARANQGPPETHLALSTACGNTYARWASDLKQQIEQRRATQAKP